MAVKMEREREFRGLDFVVIQITLQIQEFFCTVEKLIFVTMSDREIIVQISHNEHSALLFSAVGLLC